MGGKRLSFPKRKKFVSHQGEITADKEVEEKPITPEEHNSRIEMLKKLGLIK